MTAIHDPKATPEQVRPKRVRPVPIAPPPAEHRVRREARFAAPGERKTRYSLPHELRSPSVVGYRQRLPLTAEEIERALPLLALQRPTAFAPTAPITEAELFEESALGVLSSRQSTNFRGHRQVTLGPEDSAQVSALLGRLTGRNAAVLAGAAYTHLIFSRPYRTSFTALLTVIGHPPIISPVTVAWRALRKQIRQLDDIPTITYLRQLHLGILADALERAVVIASRGQRRAQIHMAPFCGDAARSANRDVIRTLERLGGIGPTDRLRGWSLDAVAQVGGAAVGEGIDLPADLSRKLGANLLAFRSERIQPGVNQEEKAPAPYQTRQPMDVPDELIVMAGRAGYNAFAHWTDCDRERSKDLLLLERIDVLTPGGKERLRAVRRQLGEVTDAVLGDIPKWVDLLSAGAVRRGAERGRKAFALAGQRIYIGGLSRREIEAEGIEWNLAVRGVGAAAARSGLLVELMGVLDLPTDCDLLAGVCLMAGPVNQNDTGKRFFGHEDLLRVPYPDRDPTSLLVWTMKAKTVADPIGNEEQLQNPKRKGALVDLRPAPHEVVSVRRDGRLQPMRRRDGRINDERAFGDIGNFVCDPDGQPIPGNAGTPWPDAWRAEPLWP